MNGSIDDLELELRRLPGVGSAGIEVSDDVMVVHLDLVGGEEQVEPGVAARIVAQHSDLPAAVAMRRRLAPPAVARAPASTSAPPPPPAPPPPTETVVSLPQDQPAAEPGTASAIHAVEDRPGRGRRVRLLSVLTFPDSHEIEVHLVGGEQRSVGRASTDDGVLGATRACVSAITELRPDLTIDLRWARELTTDDDTPIVAVSLVVDDHRTELVRCYGVATAEGPRDAAARATLDALNRQLDRD